MTWFCRIAVAAVFKGVAEFENSRLLMGCKQFARCRRSARRCATMEVRYEVYVLHSRCHSDDALVGIGRESSVACPETGGSAVGCRSKGLA